MHKPSFFRQTWVEVDLQALASNYRFLKSMLPKGTKVMAAVKANAYGHGIVEVSRKLIECGIDYLGVACIDEALALRKHFAREPILNLGVFLRQDIGTVLKNNITVTVANLNAAKILNAAARSLKKKANVHVKIDTGMGRLGVWHEEAEEFIIALCSLRNLTIEGLYTHFPSADSDEAFTKSQITAFCVLVNRLQIRGIDIPIKHAANSMAVIGFKDAHFNLVRPGLALYGLHPKDDLLGKIGLKPILSFKTKVVYLKKVASGRSISYGRTYVTDKEAVIATLPVGYGDGYNRHLSNKGHVIIRGVSCPVVGVVCMDQTMVDVSRVKGVKIEDKVVLIGSQGAHKIRVEEIATLCHTIPYEVVCWISPRVPRVYIN
ncbi:MAG: alanine racemase [Candidatus Omnitrophica bacterium CG1_02_44_16]|nr:MAG: alanine racemase [Candidatus Omnitrophica bacterium CG1_02_44_16]PIY82929.1 MAG: alanine racemase [Candidatus Omnitrophica bacterium CG_4_10_14_0_8_um_filter_44_12]PIZ84263.1 MAG: alanine racemase [Candidatus Omnitrophica bacterium CG_4_10_14_0_2_um_filter_44_9]